MEAMTHVREHTHCRVCQSAQLETYLDLGHQPLANAFRTPGDTSAELTAPLVLARCLHCGLSQLRHVVDRDVLYRHYLYESGHSAGWRKHCEDLAGEIAEFKLRGSVVYDIASNDGTLVDALERHGMNALGIDPAENLNARIKAYWSTDLIKDWGRGCADAIVAQNVFGHVDDVSDFFAAIKFALDEDGTAIIECPHVIPMIESCAFDTVYHEHLSYWSLTPLSRLAGQVGLAVVDVEMFPEIHGGTCRYYLRHIDQPLPEEGTRRVLAMLDWEEDTLTPGYYADFGRMVRFTAQRLSRVLAEHAPVYAYGASAKSTVLLNAVREFDGEWCPSSIAGVFDDTPGKWGKRIPGIGLPILAPIDDMSQVGALLITAPNWKDGILAKAEARGFNGTAISPWHGVRVETA